ncbi:GNAT family N-acetyltransferase [Flavobacterium amniphilum]|uniref:GNAT family N-acetyltransferase n=1 Tax=Flavobacterium amniphilum TaxID=1834035 RepID=UPI00202A6AA1|nr:GNAT family N-acetyltransferase [Flavobacterium amniphilum]MCL9804544.1 GNAT family N-acetyltransferase [Flavobacterium amniphilum]
MNKGSIGKYDTRYTVYSYSIPELGLIEFRPLQLDADSVIIHDWVNREYAKYWGLLGKSLEEVKKEYEGIIQHSDVFIGLVNGTVSFMLERYDPKKDIIGKYYEVRDYDCGIHIIVAPADTPRKNFTWHIFSSIMKFIFNDLTVKRILVEPDIRNQKMFDICHRVGFVDDKTIELPHKTAKLAFCTREQFIKKVDLFNLNDTIMQYSEQIESPEKAIQHIEASVWNKANQLLVKKAICEFSHELIITPKIENENGKWNDYVLIAEDNTIEYRFKAQLLSLNHLAIEENSIVKTKGGAIATIDAVDFIMEFKKSIGISEDALPSYVEEIISTLYGSAYKLVKNNPPARALAKADFQTIEQAMTEGHPGFVANNGRIGFNSMDYKAFTPETGNPFQIIWLAGHRDRTVYAGTQKLDYDTLINQELDAKTMELFNQVIISKGAKPEDYYFIPVHPWQWFNKLANLFSPEIAKGKLICLGYGSDLYQAQQSIRTLFNVSHPHKLYTKTSLSILNMGFMRGLPVYYLGTAPEMAEWLEDILGNDPYLQDVNFGMLGEVASVSYVNPYFADFGKHNPYNKMIASLWRESPVAFLKNGQQLMTMAAFLHIDAEGNALLPEIIKASPLSTDEWLYEYFKVYLTPLLHCFYQYDLVFMPHGENLIIGLENHVPVRSFLKDITEEAVILNPEVEIPKNIDRMYAEVPEDVKLLSIFIDVFDGFFRFMSAVLVTDAGYDEKRFWELVALSISDYQKAHPHLAEKFERYDLFAPDFELSCLNRLQLNNNKTMIDLDDPVALLQFQGRLTNPVAPYKPVTISTESI